MSRTPKPANAAAPTARSTRDWSRKCKSARLRQARKEAGYINARDAALQFGWNINTYGSNENGNAPFSHQKAKAYAAAFGVRVDWLIDAEGPMLPITAQGAVPVVGRVGANPNGEVLFATGDDPGDIAPIPPGGTERARALLVVGHSMRGLADDGSLIYFEDQRSAPTADMLGHVVVAELDTDEVLVKRLLRGSKAGLYDLESIAGPTRRDARLRWAAHITAIIPPFQARRILRSLGG